MPEDSTIDQRREAAEAYVFHDIHPNVHFGTASDRYAGWIGQIYPEDEYADRVSTRKRKLGGQTFEERRVPIESATAYFEHFSVLEIDFTFYRPLLEADGEPSSNYHVLQNYAEESPSAARFLLKTPQDYFAPTVRRQQNGKTTYVDNPDYLNADAYVERFHEPAQAILGDRLAGVIFEQAYRRVGDSPSAEDNVAELDGFFSQIPTGDVQAHLELRSEHLLEPPYFDWLDDRGLGFVFSHWTWLPPIRKQWAMCGEHFTAGDHSVVARLLTPRNVKYAEAYATAYPFDEPEPSITETQDAQDMVLDATALIFQAEQHNALLNLIANNRAWGNAPALAQTIAHRTLDEVARRS